MTKMTDTARAFFEACEAGKGWETCKEYCTSDASFSAQAEPLLEVKTLADYCDWMKGLIGFMPDAAYELKAFAADGERQCVVAYAIFTATHTGEGGPCPPTGKRTSSDYVYVMQFSADKIVQMTKIWHAGLATKELGWV